MYTNCFPCSEDLKDIRTRSEACATYRQMVEERPDVEAILRHVSSIPCQKERHRVLVEWKQQMLNVRSIHIEFVDTG